METKNPFGWKIISGEQLLKLPTVEAEFLVEKLVPKAGITMIAGHPSSGKSWMLMEIAKATSSSRFIFGKFSTEVEGIKVLYIDAENVESEMNRRWKLLDPPMLTLTDFFPILAPENSKFRLDNTEERQKMIDYAVSGGYSLVIIDALRDVVSGNENDSSETQKWIGYLREFVTKGISVLICHHSRKDPSFPTVNKDLSQSIRGSSAILAGLDSLLTVEMVKEEDSLLYSVYQSKLRQGKPAEPFKVRLSESEGKMSWEYVGEIVPELSKLQKAKDEVLDLLGRSGRFAKDILEALQAHGYSQRTVFNALSELVESGAVTKDKIGRQTFYEVKRE